MGDQGMGIRFPKSIKIAPGVRVNLSKSGVSTSVGGKGLTANFSKRGTRVTAGIPGSGLSASKLYKNPNASAHHQPTQHDQWLGAAFAALVIFIPIAIYSSGALRVFSIVIAAASALGLVRAFLPK